MAIPLIQQSRIARVLGSCRSDILLREQVDRPNRSSGHYPARPCRSIRESGARSRPECHRLVGATELVRRDDHHPADGQPSSPTMSDFVRFVTAGLGVPPRWRTTSKASARLMQASRPVKATENLSAELVEFNSRHGSTVTAKITVDSLLAGLSF